MVCLVIVAAVVFVCLVVLVLYLLLLQLVMFAHLCVVVSVLHTQGQLLSPLKTAARCGSLPLTGDCLCLFVS